ncbi:PREDICTED: disease resistance protein TAO1-like [Camelina sativa]|uniref:ADP-ribosyl cyclase/cyclic ADP-ribose hydrolase n=1 Tax=Camelina sativa TaxID=90675 RepID=A0ABM0XW24_CAMSA|nr:PREDICTED: disease resistance protein TAO1-like [Camelina sativa]
MDSSFFLTTVAAAIGLFTLWRKVRVHQDNKETKSSSSTLPLPPSSLSCIWTHQVFPSFRGEDVRRDFLSHIQMEFQRMGITPFIDNEIKRGEFIGPELTRAIRGSKIAIILLSRNYASSRWCLDELVEIMKCREEIGQTVMVIFYKVDPSSVKKLTGEFGKVFRKTCAGKTKQDIGRWTQALAEVATVAGYHSSNWDNEAAMVKKIATDISNILLINLTPSSDFDRLVGMKSHLEKMKPLLCLESDEVRMIGIWGPPGIGKTTIARVVYNQLSNNFQLSVFMENIKANYTTPSSDDYSIKLRLQQQFMSQITNHKDMEISHLGVVYDRLKDKKVLVVLDGVDDSVQLDAMGKENSWFGPGSRIIVTTQDHQLFRAHGINHIYKVDFPLSDEALQIFCMNAFDQKSPKDGFEELARKVTRLVGDLPLGLRVMGSYFRGRSKQEWTESLPRLYTSLPGGIQSILKLIYDALDDDDKDLFLYIACLFNHLQMIKRVEELLAKRFLGLRQRLNVLAEKSLISIDPIFMEMHSLLQTLGRDIVRKHEPGQRQFLVDEREICEVLTSDGAGSKNIIGIKFGIFKFTEELYISEKAFEGMSNLQLLILDGYFDQVQLRRGLSFISRKLRLLEWSHFPMTSLPSIVNVAFLVELNLKHSKLEKLWEGIKPLRNLKSMNLSYSVKLKELPDLSTATNLQELTLRNCYSLVKLPSSVGCATNLQSLDLSNCSSLVKLPSSIGCATNLQSLDLSNCSSLVELPSSIGCATNLQSLDLSNCSSLVELPSSIGCATNLQSLDLSNCSSLVELPSSIGCATNLQSLDLSNCSSLVELPSSIGCATNLQSLDLSNCSSLVELPSSIGCATNLQSLDHLVLKGCRELVSLSQITDSISTLDAEDCESLERLDCSFHNPMEFLNFGNCFKLNQEARDLIIHTPTAEHAILPGGEVPSYFTHRATSGGLLTIKLNERPLPTSMTFKACILLVYIGGDEAGDKLETLFVDSRQSERLIYPVLTEHLYIFEVEEEVTSNELVFEFKVDKRSGWKIAEFGLHQLLEVDEYYESLSSGPNK